MDLSSMGELLEVYPMKVTSRWVNSALAHEAKRHPFCGKAQQPRIRDTGAAPRSDLRSIH